MAPPESHYTHRVIAFTKLSQTRLYVAFEEYLGQTPTAVLTRIRVEKAQRMLSESDEQVRAISAACGFGDVVNVYRTFQRLLGVSPQGWRVQSKSDFPPAAGELQRP